MFYNGMMQLILIDGEKNLFLNLNNMELIRANRPVYEGDNVSWSSGEYLGHIKDYIKIK